MRGDVAAAKFAVFHLKGDLVQAVEAVNAPPEFMAGKQLIAKRTPVSLEKLADPGLVIGACIDRSQDPSFVDHPDRRQRVYAERARDGSTPAQAIEVCRPIRAKFSKAAVEGYSALIKAYRDHTETLLGKHLPR